MKKLMFVAVAVVAFAVVSKAEWDDDLPESFDSYVKQTSDGPVAAGNLASPFTDGEYWSSNEPPDGDHDYFVPAAREFNTPFWSGPTVTNWTFRGRSLVVQGKFRQLEGAGKANITIPELYWLGGSDMYYTGAKSAMMGNLHIRRSSAENPANFKISYSGIDLQKSKMKLDGDTNQVIKVFLGDSYVVKNTINGESFQGDLSAYYGTFEVHTNQHFQINGSMPGKVVMVDGNVWLENCGDAALAVGAVDARAASCIVTSAGKNMSVGDLSLSADAVLQIGYAQNVGIGSVEVTNSLSFVDKINIEVSGMASEPMKAGDFVLVRVHSAALPEKGLAFDDFNIVGLPVFYGADLLFRDDEDGGKTLVVRAYEKITHLNVSTANNGQPTNSFTSATNYAGKAYWSNGLCPANDPDAANHVYESAVIDYYLPQSSEIYEFPGKKLLSGKTLNCFSSNAAGFRGHIVFLGDAGTHGNAGIWKAETDPEMKKNRNVQRFEGRITLPVESQMVSNLKYGDAMVVWASEIDGVGGMKFTTYPSASAASSNQGWHELTGANVNWKGKVLLTQDYSKPYSDGTVTPNWDYNVRLILNDGRNLGGRRDTFAADALKIEHYARVMIRDDVTLADGLNRGITVGDVGRFWQPAGKTLTVNQPIVLNGMLVKEGEGTLVLGGNDLTASSDAKVVITNGAIKVTHAHALNGAAVSFAAGTKLIIPVGTDATTDFAKFGAINTLGDDGFTSTATDGKISVAFELPNERSLKMTAAICTVKSESTLTKDSFALIRPRGYSVTLSDPVDNGDGTKTFKVTLKRKGLIVIAR